MAQGELIDSIRRLKESIDLLTAIYSDYKSKKDTLLYYILDTNSIASFSISDDNFNGIIETDDYYFILVNGATTEIRKYDKIKNKLLASNNLGGPFSKNTITKLGDYIYTIADNQYIAKYKTEDLSYVNAYDLGSADYEGIASDGTYLYINKSADYSNIYRVTLHDDTNTATISKVYTFENNISYKFGFIGDSYFITSDTTKISLFSLEGKLLSTYTITNTIDGLGIYYNSTEGKYHVWVATSVSGGSYANKYELKDTYKPIIDKTTIYGSYGAPFAQTSDGKLQVDTELTMNVDNVNISDVDSLLHGYNPSSSSRERIYSNGNKLQIDNPPNLDEKISTIHGDLYNSTDALSVYDQSKAIRTQVDTYLPNLDEKFSDFIGTPASTPPTKGMVLLGFDGTNLQRIKTTTDGKVILILG